MRNAMIGIGLVLIVGVAAVLGWFTWQNAQHTGALSAGDTSAQGEVVALNNTEANNTEANNTEANGTEANGTEAEAASVEFTQEGADAIGAEGVAGIVGGLRFVYLWNNRVGIWHGGDDVTLATTDATHPPRISHDASLVAFVRDGGLWVMSAEGEQERLLVSESEIEGMGGDMPARLHRFAWLPGTHHLLFNTALNVDMGFLLTNDLYRVEVDSLDLAQLLPPNEGGEFTIAPDGRAIAVVSPDRIRVIDAEGIELRPDFAYEPVNTYSEFAYYLQPVWSVDSGRLAVVVPHPEGFVNAQEPAAVWTLPAGEGEAQQAGQILSGAPSYWIDPTLQRVAYMQLTAPSTDEDAEIDLDAMTEGPGFAIQIARLDGSEVQTSFEGEGQFLGWSPDGTRFAIATPGEAETIQLGAVDETELMPLTGLNYAFSHQVTWIDARHYLVTAVDAMDTTVALGSVAADELSPLLELEAGAFELNLVALNGPK